MREMRDTLRAAFTRVLPNRRRGLRSGTLERFPFSSSLLGNDRQITVYLPPGYHDRQERRYPVLYMQDGQNLFDPERSFAGETWRLAAAADEAIGAHTARPMIIVGVDHAAADRIEEYTPVPDQRRGAGGRADRYGRMLVEELKPLIDARYRTDPQESALGGSSLGGLATLYLGLAHPETFGRLAVLSPSVWWNGRAILGDVDRFEGERRPAIWLDTGGREGAEALAGARELRDRLLAKGWDRRRDLRYFEDRRANHSEEAWARRARAVLEYLFPPVQLSASHAD
jgi:predicted alpha/beta superfamily hydrolase